MAKEIERKFLVAGERWRNYISHGYTVPLCRQGYLSHGDATVRVRTFENRGYITVKSPNDGISRDEWEYEIPVDDADEMLTRFCANVVIKARYYAIDCGAEWSIDEFFGRNAGLVLAEVELAFLQQVVELPTWVSTEVSDDPRYYSSNLAEHPYQEWKNTLVS